MQAIQTKYLGPTNHRGSRIAAKCAAGSLTVGYDYALGIDENHAAAAEALRTKLGWTREADYGETYSGVLYTGCCAHVIHNG